MARNEAAELFDEVPEVLAETVVEEKPVYRLTLDKWKKFFKDYQNFNPDKRREQVKNYQYYDNDQLTREEKAALAERGQPEITINRFRVAINGILGIVSHSRADPRALGRTPSDGNSADVATDVLRYVTHRNRFKHEKKYLLKDNLLGGVCAILVGVNEDGDIDLVPIRFEEFFYDPRSKRTDFKDARYMGLAKWMYADEVVDLLPNDTVHASRVDALISDGAITGRMAHNDELFDDRPIDQTMVDKEHQRVQVIECYAKVKGVWTQCLFWEGGIISEIDSPYLDSKKRPSNPIEAQSCYVDKDNNRIGYASDLRDLQDEINKRRQKALWEISSNQIEAADPSAIEVDADQARKEAARPDGVMPYGWKKVPGTDRAAGNMMLLNEAKQEMERFSPNPAMLGRQGSDTSGRAMLARQQAGLIELSVVLDQFEDLELRTYKQIWARGQQYWTEEMYIRTTDDIEDPKYTILNKEVREKPMLDEAGQPVLDEAGQPVMVPSEGGAILGYENQIAEMDIDIIIDTVPETATIMAEQLTELRNMVSSNPNYANEVPFEIFLEMTNLPRKRELIRKIQEHRKLLQEGQAKEAEQQRQVMLAELDAKIKQTLADAGLKEAQGQAALAGAQQGEIRTAVQADKALAGIDAEATRVQMEGARTTNEIMATPKPAAGATGDSGGEGQ